MRPEPGHGMIGRGERIRTFDFYLPKVALYQAELHPALRDNDK